MPILRLFDHLTVSLQQLGFVDDAVGRASTLQHNFMYSLTHHSRRTPPSHSSSRRCLSQSIGRSTLVAGFRRSLSTLHKNLLFHFFSIFTMQ
jgi:hypothetical protein